MYPTMFKLPYLPDWLADIKSYGVMMTIAFLTGIWMSCRRADKSGGNPDTVLNIGFIALIFGIAGARLMYVLHYWDSRFATQPHPYWAIIDIRAGGLEFWGGPILAIPAIAIYLRYIAKASARWYLDMAAPALAWGLAVTRIGCFLNGCCWGATCVDPHDPSREQPQYAWAVQFPFASPAMTQQYRFGQLTLPKELIYVNERSGESFPMPRQFLLEAVEDDGQQYGRLQVRFQAAFAELAKAQKEGVESEAYARAKKESDATRDALTRFRSTPIGNVEVHCQKYGLTAAELLALADHQHFRSKPVHPVQLYETVSALLISLILGLMFYYRRRHGIVLPWFLILYSISRVVHELIRQDNPLDVGGVTISQAISAVTFSLGVIGLWWLYNKMPMVSPRVVPYIPPQDDPAPGKSS
jgi:phosphatidylglycerol:prolipoprotein diacylglycerol transferase